MIHSSRARRGLVLVVVGALVLFAASAAPRVHAATVVVNDLSDSFHRPGCATSGTGECTLRDAIFFTNFIPGADIITFALGGTITLDSALPDIEDDLTIDGAVTTDGVTQHVTVSGAGHHRVMSVLSGSVRLNALTITGGNVQASGGGIYSAGTLTITNSVIADNRAFVGAGIYNDRGTVTIALSTIRGNRVSLAAKGGGIASEAGVVDVSDSTIEGNWADQGGGIFGAHGTVFNIARSTFHGNVSFQLPGGALSGSSIDVNITNSTFYDNRVEAGVGSGTEPPRGGALWIFEGSVNITNSTFYKNVATRGLSIVLDGPLGSYRGTVRNTIVADLFGCDSDGVALDVDLSNLTLDRFCNGGVDVPLESLDLADLADNGGPTHTVAIGANSLAIGRGHDNVCAASPVNNEDQRGVTRPQGSHCDIGAFERHRRADLPTRRRVGSSADH